MSEDPTPLTRFLMGSTEPPADERIDVLCASVRERLGDAVLGIVFYGSVVHGLADEDDALHDLMVIVDDYRSAYPSLGPRLANWLLPPNVFYLETGKDTSSPRCKFTVISIGDLERYTSLKTRQVYFWGRYAQPCLLAAPRDEEASRRIIACLETAVITFSLRALSLLDDTFTQSEFWTRGLSACYGSELRPEDPDRAAAIVARSREHFRTAAMLVLPMLGTFTENTQEWDPVFTNGLTSAPRRLGRLGWMRRRIEGKALNIMRLVKAVFTFDGGVDYALWKIRRHSGEDIEVSERVRKHPLLFGWPDFFRIWRRGLLSSRKPRP